ncbi:hypothetical protein [Terriglobus tenax]|uniref:hypothetical protein n=1 Tax=Terriglobus tenax TaxID=1111115 RepID=UPI0021E07D77|nr:hypothetical protein [Terriglobus tenax]
MKQRLQVAALSVSALTFALTACKKTDDVKPNYAGAIDTYYAAHPSCVWSTPQQFPVQVAHSDDDKTRQFDALVDQGLLTRTSTEKKIIIVSKQMNNYDVSEKGRSAWTADSSQPGYGNFCYGHRKVSSIDSNTPTNDQPGATTSVAYHYTLDSVPDWAKAAETQTAFPSIQTALAGPRSATATLTNTTQGWQLTKAGSGAGNDSGIVE